MTENYAISKRQATKLAALIGSREDWIHRRVEAIHFTKDGYTQRHVSLDITFPKFNLRDKRILPITLLNKRVTLKDFDMRTSNGESLPILTRGQAANVAVSILQSGIDIPNMGRPDILYADNLLQAIVNFKSEKYRPEELEFFKSQLSTQYAEMLINFGEQDPYLKLRYLANELLVGHLLFVELPALNYSNSRGVIKFSYEEPMELHNTLYSKLTNLETQVKLDWSNSFHFEVRAPRSLLVDELLIFTKDDKDLEYELKEESSKDRSGERIANVSTNSQDRGIVSHERSFVQLALRSEFRGFPARTFVWVIATFLILSFQAWPTSFLTGHSYISFFIPPNVQPKDGIAIPVMLLASLALFFSGEPDHDVVSWIQTIPRVVMISCAAELFFTTLNAAGLMPISNYHLTSMILLISFVPVALFLGVWLQRSVRVKQNDGA